MWAPLAVWMNTSDWLGFIRGIWLRVRSTIVRNTLRRELACFGRAQQLYYVRCLRHRQEGLMLAPAALGSR